MLPARQEPGRFFSLPHPFQPAAAAMNVTDVCLNRSLSCSPAQCRTCGKWDIDWAAVSGLSEDELAAVYRSALPPPGSTSNFLLEEWSGRVRRGEPLPTDTCPCSAARVGCRHCPDPTKRSLRLGSGCLHGELWIELRYRFPERARVELLSYLKGG